MLSVKTRKIIKCTISVVLLVFGGIGFFDLLGYKTSSKEVPLGAPMGIVVDSHGKIYCGLHFYSKVQVYDNNGTFLYNIHINAGDGDFKLSLDKQDNLSVATVRTNNLYVFDNTGRIIREESRKGIYDKYSRENDFQYTDSKKATYKIKNPLFLFPHIVKTTSDGKVSTVVYPKLANWFFMGPLPAWLFWCATIILWIKEINVCRNSLTK